MTLASTSSPTARMRLLKWALPPLALAVVMAGIGLWHGNKAAAVLRADPETILGNSELSDVALATGKPVYQQHCASCHGLDGKGDRMLGAPDLTDANHLYGDGTVSQTEDIARYGIRAGNKRGWNLAVMPAYAHKVPDAAEALPPQTPAQIEALTQFLLSFTARQSDNAAAKQGREVYTKAGCWDCHGRDMGGDPAIGAPGLTDDIWLYGGRPEDIRRSISSGRAGTSPAFGRTLTPVELRNVALYVASLSRTKLEEK